MKALLLALPLLLAAGLASACEVVTAGGIEIEQAWLRASVGADRPGIVYVTIRDVGAEDDALVGVSTPAASMPMLHETMVTDDIARMPHAMSIPVPADETAMLEPGGRHAMPDGLTAAPDEGATVPLMLTFETAGEVTVEVEVGATSAPGPTCGHRGGAPSWRAARQGPRPSRPAWGGGKPTGRARHWRARTPCCRCPWTGWAGAW